MRESPVQTVGVRLADGWSGRVAIAPTESARRPTDGKVGPTSRNVGSTSDISLTLPPAAEWPALLERLLISPEKPPGYAALKHSTDGEVFRARLEGSTGSIEVIVKRSHPRGLRRCLAFALRGGRERRNFDRALELLEAGIEVPTPLAALDRRRPRRETCLVSAFVPDLVDLDRAAMRDLPRLEPTEAYRVKHAVMSAVVELLRRLYDRGLTHRDFKASNIMLRHWDGRGGPVSVWLVDLDGVRPLRARSTSRQWHPIIRLAASLMGYAGVTRADRLRFLRLWMGGASAGRPEVKRRYRRLSDLVSAYNVSARRRKADKLDGYSGD